MINRQKFLSEQIRKLVAGLVMCVFLLLTLLLTFPVMDSPVPVISDAEAGYNM